MLWTILRILFLGLIPPVIWRMARGSRLADKKEMPDRRWVDRDDFLWQVCISIVGLFTIASILVAAGLLPVIGPGYAIAGDALDKRIDKKVEARIEQSEQKLQELTREQAKITDTVNGIKDLLLDQLTETTQAKIRNQVSKRCKTLGAAEREEINREIERLQKSHVQYTNQRYREPRCEEL